MVSLGGGKNSSETKTLNSMQRRSIYQGGLKDIGSTLGIWNPGTEPQFIQQGGPMGLSKSVVNPKYNPTLDLPDYQAATYADAGPATRLGGGDYGRLEESIKAARWAPLDALKTQRFSDIDQEMADRGLYASGVGADTKQSIFSRDFLPAYSQAAGEATATRYGLEQADNQAANAFALQSANMANQFNMQDAAGRNQAAWAPLDYLMGLYNQTGGSNSRSSGWNASASVAAPR